MRDEGPSGADGSTRLTMRLAQGGEFGFWRGLVEGQLWGTNYRSLDRIHG